MSFQSNTFKYFKAAKRNKDNRDWFLKNEKQYIQYVKEPFVELIEEINEQLGKDLAGIKFSVKSISRPLRPSNRSHEGIVKDFASILIAEKRTSIFEWNPGIYIHIGLPEDSLIGVGIYFPTARQTSQWRHAVVENPLEIHKILSQKKFLKAWKGLQGEKFIKGPKNFNIDEKYRYLLMNKQFHITKKFTESEMTSKKFNQKVIQDLKLAMPYLHWLRKKMGTYKKSPKQN